MRLTLRTLLAYLDDILDPADKEQLAKKIESSEFAEDLVHRTRDTVRRLRLSAPQVIGSGMGLDPNTVAEYLDNVLPPESVGDYERICLESDMHLAEAAACHHVLTMVLGEPADVDPLARQRMYTIPAEGLMRARGRVESTHVPAASLGTIPAAPIQAQPVAAPAPVVPRAADANGVPEYLRTSSWTGSRLALAALAAVVLIGTAIFFVSGMGGWFAGPAETALATANQGANEFVAAPPSVPPLDQNPAPSAATEQALASDTNEQTIAAAPLGAPPQLLTPGIASAPAATSEPEPDRYAVPDNSTAVDVRNAAPPHVDSPPTVSTDATVAAPVAPEIGPQDAPAIAAADVSPPLALPNDPAVDGATAHDSLIDEQAGSGTAPMTMDSGVDGDAAAAESDQSVDPQATAEEEVPAGPAELGTYLGGKTVLLRYDDQAGAWFRVEPRSAVVAGQRLLALPEFRPKVTLGSGIHLDVSGGTQLTMGTANEVPSEGLPNLEADVPLIDISYGRVILINTSNEENQLRLVLGSNVADARLAFNSTLAIEVERQYVPGQDPRKSPAPVIVRLYVPNGGVEWQDAAGTKKVENASRWTITDGATSEVVADSSPPDWIDQEPVVQLSEQRYGAPVVESTLVSDKPADIQLLELFQGNGRKEVKSLAAKSSIHVGLFGPFIDALRDSDQKSNWRTHIATLRSAMALSPDSASHVWKALVEQRDRQAAADLYEMLCGYNEEQIGRNPEQIKSGALLRLIDWLEEDSLDYRVLAVHDLGEITGKKLMPDPAANPKERAQNVRRWRTRLEEDDLQPVRRK